MTSRSTTIIGAGLAGAALSALLASRGARVQLLERHGDSRQDDAKPYSSINLALSYRGLKCLEALGVLDRVWPKVVPMLGRQVHLRDAQDFQPYDLVGTRSLYSIRRSDLLRILLDAAEANGVRIEFGVSVRAIDPVRRTMHLAEGRSGTVRSESFDVVIGADGCHSVVRRAVDMHYGLESTVAHLDHGYRELHFRGGSRLADSLAPDALHIWPRGDFMMVALPNADGSFTATLFMTRQGNAGFQAMSCGEAVLTFLKREFPDLGTIDGADAAAFAARPVGRLITVAAPHWSAGGVLLILGDAAHAIAPFLGQGMNCALEDCVCFGDVLDRHGSDLAAALVEFEECRRPHVDAIARMSLDNYVEMRETVTHSDHGAKRAMMRELQSRFPSQFAPLYSMIAFSDIPYATAWERHLRMEEVISRLMAANSRQEIDWVEAARLIDQRLGSEVPLPAKSFFETMNG